MHDFCVIVNSGGKRGGRQEENDDGVGQRREGKMECGKKYLQRHFIEHIIHPCLRMITRSFRVAIFFYPPNSSQFSSTFFYLSRIIPDILIINLISRTESNHNIFNSYSFPIKREAVCRLPLPNYQVPLLTRRSTEGFLRTQYEPTNNKAIQ